MSLTTFSGPVQSQAGFLYTPVLLAEVAAITPTLGLVIFVSDASSGLGALCFGNGTDFIDIATGLPVA